jgi:hypothetical protein
MGLMFERQADKDIENITHKCMDTDHRQEKIQINTKRHKQTCKQNIYGIYAF